MRSPSASARARSSTCWPRRRCRSSRPKTLPITVDGELPAGSTAKDIILAILGRIGTGGGIGYVAEYRGSAIRALSMEGRMTVCNMSIEAGAKAGLIAPDDTTFAYLQGRDHAPKGDAWEAALADWRSLSTDEDATFDKEVALDAAEIRPHVSWGTNPGQVVPIDARFPSPDSFADAGVAIGGRAGARVHGSRGGHAHSRHRRRHRLHRLVHQQPHRGPAGRRRGRATATTSHRACAPWWCPGSWAVKHQAEAEGLHEIFRAAGFDWRDPGCSMCLAMNPDKLAPGERCASTSNRNFEGRQGRGGRTHLVSPAVAAATAIAGHFATPEDLKLMEAVRIVQGTAVPLDRSDVDTDQIIPSDWLKRVERTGFEKGLFSEWRDDPSFVMNDERLRRRDRSWSPGRTSARARRASTRCGRSSRPASKR